MIIYDILCKFQAIGPLIGLTRGYLVIKKIISPSEVLSTLCRYFVYLDDFDCDNIIAKLSLKSAYFTLKH